MSEYILRKLGSDDRSLLSLARRQSAFECTITKRTAERPSSRNLLNQWPIDNTYTYGSRTPKLYYFDGISQVFPERDHSDNECTHNQTRLPCVSVEAPIQVKSRLQSYGGKTMKRPMKKYQPPTRAEWDIYFQRFAQRMKENAIQFDKLCATATDVPERTRQQASSGKWHLRVLIVLFCEASRPRRGEYKKAWKFCAIACRVRGPVIKSWRWVGLLWVLEYKGTNHSHPHPTLCYSCFERREKPTMGIYFSSVCIVDSC